MYWFYTKHLIKFENLEAYLNKLEHLAFETYEVVSIFQYLENVCVIIKYKIKEDDILENTEEDNGNNE